MSGLALHEENRKKPVVFISDTLKKNFEVQSIVGLFGKFLVWSLRG